MIKKILNKILELSNFIFIMMILIKKNYNFIIFRDLPGQVLIFSAFKKLLKLKIIYQLTAPIGDMTIVYGKQKKSIYKYFYFLKGYTLNFLNDKAIQKAEIIFPISEHHKEVLKKKYRKKLFVPISMGIDNSWISSKKIKICFLDELKNKNKIITYFGTLNSTRNPQFLIKILYNVKKKVSNCKLFIIGKSNEKKQLCKLKSFAKKLGLQNDVYFTGNLSRKKLQKYLRYSDLSLSAIPPVNIYRYSSPTKIYESLGNSIPVIANKGILEHEKVLKESGGGFLVNYEVKEFADAVIILLSDKKLKDSMGQKGRKYVIKNYNYKNIAQKIDKILCNFAK
jgi:glycosyltransferase involved in cell wall biosynthesis